MNTSCFGAQHKSDERKKSLLEASVNPLIYTAIKDALNAGELGYLIGKTNTPLGISTLFKKICNARCVQKRKPYTLTNLLKDK